MAEDQSANSEQFSIYRISVGIENHIDPINALHEQINYYTIKKDRNLHLTSLLPAVPILLVLYPIGKVA